MASKMKFENSNDIGCFMKLTNSYCLASAGYAESQYDTISSELTGVPVIPISIDGMKIIGRVTAGNKNGLLVPESITEEEWQVLNSQMPDNVEISKVNDKLSALGNVIVANDRVALIHPDLDEETESTIQRTLGVETYRKAIAGNALVGSYCTLSN